ncbi:MAG: hypothetical protein HEQ32_00020 [Vampirovibrio sp.]
MADNTIENFQAAYVDGMTYKFNDKGEKPNHIDLGIANTLKDDLKTTIILGKNDTIEGRPFAKASKVEADDRKNYIITLVDTGRGGNSAGDVKSTIYITVPKDSLESATAKLTDRQKKDLGIKEASEATSKTPIEPDFIPDEEGSNDNPYDKNQD